MTDVQTIYIAGPMSGYKNFNYDAFNAAAEVLREAGYHVLNPAEFDGGGQDDSFHNYMRKDLSIIIAEAEAVVCLQDWETSAGAKNEVTVARAIGIPVWDISNFAPISNNPKDVDTWAVDHPETPQEQPQQVWLNAPDGDYHWTFDAGKWSASPVEAYTEAWSDGLPIGEEPQEEEFSEETVLAFEAPAKTILQEADDAVNGPRQRDYDHPLDNFARIAGMWSYLFECQQCKQPVQISEEQHALAMILVKVARLMHSPNHRDSQVDLAGYAATIEKLQRERVRRDQESLLQLLADVEQWEATLVGNSAA
jgi:nucleoside 2-deoxyribosyltransferase